MVSYNELYSTLVNILECIHNEKKNLESQVQFELDKIEQQRKYLNNRDLKKELEIITAELEKEKEGYKKQLDDKIIKQQQAIQCAAKTEFKKYYNNELIEFDIKKEQNEKLRDYLFEEKRKLDEKQKDLLISIDNNRKKEKFLNELKENIYQDITKLAKERQTGFPLLAKAYIDLLKIQDMKLIEYLTTKNHPAIKASDIVREETKKRRDAEYRCKIAESVNAFYELTFPHLLEFREELPIPSVTNISEYENYDEFEREDAVTLYLSPEEYRKLKSEERNQLALDRYKNRFLSKKEIGNMYERYIGYLYEKEGYEVSYVGILKGLEDLGRDLICIKDNDIKIIQCKNWSQYKDIFENNIFQFFGTVFKYKYDINDKDRVLDNNLFENIEGIFYTTTKLSSYAKEAARFLKINVKDNFKLDKNYPCIKCNISSSGEKIYHLPFDQQYDRIKIIYSKGEFYCSTVSEAEIKGFRRALRYSYNN